MSDTINPQSTKLLLVDDDPNLILLIQDYLEFRGYQIMTANNGAEGLKALENDLPDLIICDVMMPEMDGYIFIQNVRQDPKTSWIPVIFLSAKSLLVYDLRPPVCLSVVYSRLSISLLLSE